MTRTITALTASLLLAGTASVALAERPSFDTPHKIGTQQMIPAGDLYWADDLAHLHLKPTDMISVSTFGKKKVSGAEVPQRTEAAEPIPAGQ